MNLIDSFFHMFGVKRPKSDSVSGLTREPQCPHEAEILTYSENKLSNRRRAQLESHFVSCDDCRSLLVILARFSNEMSESPAALSEEEIKKQAARVFAYIEQDDSKPRAAASETASQVQALKKREGFFVSYPQLATVALLICSICVSGIYLVIRKQNPEAAAMKELAMANIEERESEAIISGSGYLPHRTIRGPGDEDDLRLRRALNKLQSAEDDAAPAELRLMLARVHLRFDKQKHAQEALDILQRLVSEGIQSPEVLNDLGVAQYQLQDYIEAIKSFSKALEQNPDYSEALFNKAFAEERADRKEDAKRDWQYFINQTSDPHWKKEAADRLNLLSNSPNQ